MHPILDTSRLTDLFAPREPSIAIFPSGKQGFETLWNEEGDLFETTQKGESTWHGEYTDEWISGNVMTYALDSAAVGNYRGLVTIKSWVGGYYRPPRYRRAYFTARTDAGFRAVPLGHIDYAESDGTSIEEWLASLELPDEETVSSALGQSWEIEQEANGTYGIRPVDPSRTFTPLDIDDKGWLHAAAMEPSTIAVRIAGHYDIAIGDKAFDCMRIDSVERGSLHEQYVDNEGRTILKRTYIDRSQRPGDDYSIRFLNGQKLEHFTDSISFRALE